MASSPDEELRALYLDWCSARIAEHFLALSPDEVWERVHAPAACPPSGGRDDSRSPQPPFLDAVRQISRILAAELHLPPYAEWARSYREDPERYELEILGFAERTEA